MKFVPVNFNTNNYIKVKLTDAGINAYYHRNDEARAKGANLSQSLPYIDEEGYTKFQLWDFIHTFGKYYYPGGEIMTENNEIAFLDLTFLK